MKATKITLTKTVVTAMELIRAAIKHIKRRISPVWEQADITVRECPFAGTQSNGKKIRIEIRTITGQPVIGECYFYPEDYRRGSVSVMALFPSESASWTFMFTLTPQKRITFID